MPLYRAFLSIILMLLTNILSQSYGEYTDVRTPEYIVVNSTIVNGAKIQYQQVDICESTEGVRTFSGYIHLPVDSLQAVGLDQHLPINTFFWFAESRTKRDNVPLILYLNGGPGSPSTTSFLRENGPCRVNADSRTTRLNPWSWNSESNILFLDQPVNTGFSFDVPVNGTINFRGEKSPQMPQFTQNSRLIEAATIGIGSINSSHTINNTNGAVRAIWLSLSTWLQDFTPLSSKRNELGIWTASYGGHYAPALYDFTMSQNRAKAESTSLLTSQVPRIRITSIGLANACVDAATQIPTYFEMAYNNTYGLRLINESSYRSAKLAWDSPGGCKEQIEDCRRAANSIQYLGNNASANTICHNANTFCGKHIANIVSSSGRNIFDIGQRTHFLSDPTLHTYLGYLRQDEVQRALGVPVNFTDHAIDIAHAFAETGDNLLGDYLASLGRALDDGVKVSLMYGDRDYACNWLGGEALSMRIPHKHADLFQSSGYEPLYFDDSLERGTIKPLAYVRQQGNLSFARVLDSGHTINTVWPSIGFAIFNRTIFGLDIASGRVYKDSMEDFSTSGPRSTWHIQNHHPHYVDEGEEGYCYVLDLSFCSVRQLNAYLTGQARVRDYWLVEYGDGSCSPNPVEPCYNGWQGNNWYFEKYLKWKFEISVVLATVLVVTMTGVLVQAIFAYVRRPYRPLWTT